MFNRGRESSVDMSVIQLFVEDQKVRIVVNERSD
jgi:hypothetical protein